MNHTFDFIESTKLRVEALLFEKYKKEIGITLEKNEFRENILDLIDIISEAEITKLNTGTIHFNKSSYKETSKNINNNTFEIIEFKRNKPHGYYEVQNGNEMLMGDIFRNLRKNTLDIIKDELKISINKDISLTPYPSN